MKKAGKSSGTRLGWIVSISTIVFIGLRVLERQLFTISTTTSDSSVSNVPLPTVRRPIVTKNVVAASTPAADGGSCLPFSLEDWFLPGKCCLPLEPSFLMVAQRHVTDKVSTHSYHHAYQQYLAPQRCRPDLRLLEIGLGCGMVRCTYVRVCYIVYAGPI